MPDRASEIRSLFVSSVEPWPESSGNRRRMSAVLRGLATLGPVDVYILRDGDVPEPPDGLSIRHVVNGPAPRISRNVLDRVRWLATRTQVPSELVGLDASQSADAFRRWLEESDNGYDVVWCNRPVGYLAVRSVLEVPAIVDLDDLEDRKLANRLDTEVQEAGVWGGPHVPGWRRLARYKLRRNVTGWRRLQEHVAQQADRVILSNDDDIDTSGLPRSTVIANCYPAPTVQFGRSAPQRTPTLLLVGLMTYRPNADAAQWFVCHVLPLLRKKVPDVQVRIVGEAGDAVRELAAIAGVTVTGRIPDMAPELQRADLAVVPVRFGGGTRLKVLEAWAHRIPVVSTSVGASGLGARHGDHLLLADEPATFAAACELALTDRDVWDRLAEGGARRFSQRFACDEVERQVADLARHVAAKRL